MCATHRGIFSHPRQNIKDCLHAIAPAWRDAEKVIRERHPDESRGLAPYLKYQPVQKDYEFRLTPECRT